MGRKPYVDYHNIYEWIVEYKLAYNGNSPTIEEIVDGCELSSKSVAWYALERLEKNGKIKVMRGRARGIVIPEIVVSLKP